MKKLIGSISFAILSLGLGAQSLVFTCDGYVLIKEDELTGKMYQDGSSVQEISVMILDLASSRFVIKIENKEEVIFQIISKVTMTEDRMRMGFLAKMPNGYLVTIEINLREPETKYISIIYPKDRYNPKTNKVYNVISVGKK
jgi:uncharacterized protein YxjI